MLAFIAAGPCLALITGSWSIEARVTGRKVLTRDETCFICFTVSRSLLSFLTVGYRNAIYQTLFIFFAFKWPVFVVLTIWDVFTFTIYCRSILALITS